MEKFVTVKQLIDAVEMIQTQEQDAQQLLGEFRGVLQALDPQAKIDFREPFTGGPIFLGRMCQRIFKE